MDTFNIKINIDKGKLLITEVDGKNVLFEGKPFGISAEDIYPIPNSNDFILLLNYLEARKKKRKNLIRMNTIGEVVWEVESPRKKNIFGIKREDIESYTSIKYYNDLFIAYSYSGFSDTIDLNTGKLLKSIFVK